MRVFIILTRVPLHEIKETEQQRVTMMFLLRGSRSESDSARLPKTEEFYQVFDCTPNRRTKGIICLPSPLFSGTHQLKPFGEGHCIGDHDLIDRQQLLLGNGLPRREIDAKSEPIRKSPWWDDLIAFFRAVDSLGKRHGLEIARVGKL